MPRFEFTAGTDESWRACHETFEMTLQAPGLLGDASVADGAGGGEPCPACHETFEFTIGTDTSWRVSRETFEIALQAGGLG